jgi:GT2 family glycosyltransferase
VTEVVVAIPAHDEVTEIEACLAHVVHAARQALDTGACARVSVVVAAHRCTDGTAAVADAALASFPGHHVVVQDESAGSVGQVRSRLALRALPDVAAPLDRAWLMCTDADSHVPQDWISGMLDETVRRDAVAGVGLVTLRDWTASPHARSRYAAIVAAGFGPAGHSHVYGANLAVRLDAYLRVGGFRDVHAEDQDLVDRLRGAGERVASLLTPVVRTSSRHDGRAANGLSALLDRLDQPTRVAP